MNTNAMKNANMNVNEQEQEEQDEDADSLFGSPPPSPQLEARAGGRGRSPSPFLALPSRHQTQTTDMRRENLNVGTIALPGSHTHSEISGHDSVFGCGRGWAPPPPPALPASARTQQKSRSASLNLGKRKGSSIIDPPGGAGAGVQAPPHARAKSSSTSTSTTTKRGRRKTTSSTRPEPPPLTLPAPGDPIPTHLLRSQQALLGVAGVVGGVNPAKLSMSRAGTGGGVKGKGMMGGNRGKSASNPIVVDDGEGSGQETMAGVGKRFLPYSSTTAPTTANHRPDDVLATLSAMIKQKNIVPVLRGIVALLAKAPLQSKAKAGGGARDRSPSVSVLDTRTRSRTVSEPPLSAVPPYSQSRFGTPTSTTTSLTFTTTPTSFTPTSSFTSGNFYPSHYPSHHDPPPAKRKKLSHVPAGADDWDVPYPFANSEGPKGYQTNWEIERAKRLIDQLVELLREAAVRRQGGQGQGAEKIKRKEQVRVGKRVTVQAAGGGGGHATGGGEVLTKTTESMTPEVEVDDFLSPLLTPPLSSFGSPFVAVGVGVGDGQGTTQTQTQMMDSYQMQLDASLMDMNINLDTFSFGDHQFTTKMDHEPDHGLANKENASGTGDLYHDFCPDFGLLGGIGIDPILFELISSSSSITTSSSALTPTSTLTPPSELASTFETASAIASTSTSTSSSITSTEVLNNFTNLTSSIAPPGESGLDQGLYTATAFPNSAPASAPVDPSPASAFTQLSTPALTCSTSRDSTPAFTESSTPALTDVFAFPMDTDAQASDLTRLRTSTPAPSLTPAPAPAPVPAPITTPTTVPRTPTAAAGPSSRHLDRESILTRAKARREELAAALASAKVELWETTMEQGVLATLVKDSSITDDDE